MMPVRRILSSTKGQFIVFVAVSFVLLGLFVGLAIDLGRAYLLRSQLSGLVDAATLAAAKVLKGQEGLQDEAVKAACDSMLMNGMQVTYDAANGTCTAADDANFTLSVDFEPKPVPGGPDIQFVQISGRAPLNTTFMRLAKFITGNTLSSIEVAAFAEGGPERPVDLMLVLDRSGSMDKLDGAGRKKIVSLKTSVTQFLDNTFTTADQVGMVSFASRGCGDASGQDSTADDCTPDKPLGTPLLELISAVNGLCDGSANDCVGGTNTMEGLRTGGDAINAAFDDPDRATSRKAILLVTDGQPTFMKRFTDLNCERSPMNSHNLPHGPFPNGCLHGVASTLFERMLRAQLSAPSSFESITNVGGCSGSCLYKDVIAGTRSLGTGAMLEANKIRNYGFDGGKDVVIFAIAIGKDLGPGTSEPQGSLDENAKCLLARIANDPSTISNCDLVYTTTADGDTHDDLKAGIPAGSCESTPNDCIDTAQQQGKVFTVDLDGDVQGQLETIFSEIALILKLRLTI